MIDENHNGPDLTPEPEKSTEPTPLASTPPAEVPDSTPATSEPKVIPETKEEKTQPIAKKVPETGSAGTNQPQPNRAASTDDSTDVGTLSEEPVGAPTPPVPQRRAGDWQAEMSARRIAIELRKIETHIRELLQDRDLRRRRKLAGTYRWRELEDDLNELRTSRRVDPDTINEIQRLVYRRHFLFTQLRFAAATRPTWNT